MRLLAACLPATAVAIVSACGDASGPMPPLWTIAQAESIDTIRGTRLEATDCRGVGAAADSRYRRFSCAGKIVPTSIPDREVRVRYTLQPRGAYHGRRSAYVVFDVRFDAFGIP